MGKEKHAINLLIAYTRQNRTIVIVTASSGIATTLLDQSHTAYMALTLPLNLAQNNLCAIS